ncbi:MAG: prepilin peptidase [Candidatus Pacebacteria bacterium]|nr:prepilin peptidase [Candidatus Paceibacterota bacterium]
MSLQEAYLVLIGVFVFGTIIGSFANVFILRWGTGRSLNGRSSCASCGHKLSWYELIPVASYLLQKGRCRSCGARISPQYVLVEILFGVLFVAAGFSAFMTGLSMVGYATFFFSLAVIFLLTSLAVYDLRHLIIPDGMAYMFIVLAFLWGLYHNALTIPGALMTVRDGLLVASPLFLLWMMSRGRWMGFGDVKLAVGIGMLLGMLGGFSALIFAVWVGAIVSLAVLGVTRFLSHVSLARRHQRLTMKSEIPFGPFLAAATLFVFLTNITIVSLIAIL